MRIFAISLLFVQLISGTCFGAKLKVAASIYPIGDIVKQVGKDYVDVTVVLPAGASPHTFEPTPGLVKKSHLQKSFLWWAPVWNIGLKSSSKRQKPA